MGFGEYFETKEEEERSGQRKLLNGEFHDFYCSPNNTRLKNATWHV
jgi:hypothetical protein